MKKANKMSAWPDILKLMQSKLWYNDKYKLFFSTKHTNNPHEFYCFFLDIVTGKRKHGKYRMHHEGIFVEFVGGKFSVKHLANMQVYDLFIIQLTNVENELDYFNWMGIPMPVEKGQPYIINH